MTNIDGLVLQALEYIWGLSASVGWISTVLMVLGGVLMVLKALKAFFHRIVTKTKSETDDKIYNAVYYVVDLLPASIGYLISKFKK